MRKMLFKIFYVFLILYVLICALLYFAQEKLIFFPQKLSEDYQFNFAPTFEEINIKTQDNVVLNGVLFKSHNSKGLIFYLHGNAGSLSSWGQVAQTYTELHYDVFMIDYRGYGKSEGSICNEKQFFQDMQIAYDVIKQKYSQDRIIVLGYSIGTGAAAYVASVNNPGLLILQAPYYSLTDMMQHTFSIIPTFILKYKFETYKYIKDCEMPIVIFHGDHDEVVYYESSLKLKEYFKTSDTLITLNDQGHNGMTSNPNYLIEIQKTLNKK